jgi:[protein-PII] uridylyltransferase
MRWTVVADRHSEKIDRPALERELRRALDGHLDVGGRIASRLESYRHPHAALAAAPTVGIKAQPSALASVVVVRSHDRPGLLHLLARELHSAEVHISAAIVSTLGADAIDTFYVATSEGAALAPEQEERVARRLLAALT